MLPVPNPTDPTGYLKRQEEAAQASIDAANRPLPGSRYNILVLSGGVAHGAYQVGVLCGWADSGCLPEFDVVTGVSTGALIGAVAFPGVEFYSDMKRIYTTVNRRDVYRFKTLPPLGIGTTSVATNEPLRRLIEDVTSKPGYWDKVVSEHAKGRRFYVGTTNLDTMRFQTWDMGAIASEGTCEARKLYVDLLLAASALPGLLSPPEITVNIDGQSFTEIHVDGGTSRNLFTYPPSDWPGRDADPKGKLLAGGKVYVIFGGRIYGEPLGTKPKLVPAVSRALQTLLSSCQRAELFRTYTLATDDGMEFRVASIPPDYLPLFPSNEFDPEKMTALFCEGYRQYTNGTAWNQELLDESVEEVEARRGTRLTVHPDGVPNGWNVRRPGVSRPGRR